jgi:hypothetical protein
MAKLCQKIGLKLNFGAGYYNCYRFGVIVTIRLLKWGLKCKGLKISYICNFLVTALHQNRQAASDNRIGYKHLIIQF